MKKILLSMAVVAMLFAACNGKKTDEHGHDHTEGTHEHADGQEHENRSDETMSQEEFTVSNDSIAKKEIHDHEHKSGEKHSH
jgi:Ni/Co efflux regulator RcnB